MYRQREGAVYQQLLKTPVSATPPPKNREPAPRPAEKPSPLAAHAQSFGRVLTVLQNHYALLEQDQKLMLMALPVAARWLKQAQLEPGEEGLKPQPLLIPVRLKIALDERQAAKKRAACSIRWVLIFSPKVTT